VSAAEFGGMGFALGVVRGARSFKVDKLGRLTGVTYEQVWRPDENTAECRRPTDDTYDALQRMVTNYLYTSGYSRPRGVTAFPEPRREKPLQHSMETCQCGFYGYYDGSNDYYKPGFVSAVVEGYGETLIGSRGFRASKARIVALRIPKHVPVPLATLIARNYPSIPLFDKFSRMVAEFPPDAGGQEVTPTSDPTFWEREA